MVTRSAPPPPSQRSMVQCCHVWALLRTPKNPNTKPQHEGLRNQYSVGFWGM